MTQTYRFVVMMVLFGTAFRIAPASDSTRHKVYADYHSARYTREHDGALGLWKFSTVGKTSRVANPVVNRNADLIDDSGRHELAAADYPQVGMQSELDPDYIEYQILSAKSANIDGFFVEWGYFEHPSERIRQALTKVAARYDFEIGINLCDRWLFTQIQNRHPELKTREQLVTAFIANYERLLRVLSTELTTVRFNGQPVVLLFGDGLLPNEFDRLNRAIAAANASTACVLIRPKLAAQITPSGKLVQSWDAAPWFDPNRGFHSGVSGFFGWVPTRARTDVSGEFRRQFDRYGTIDDSLDYLKLITAQRGSGPRVSSATPGFDNRNCAGWGSDFSLLERGDGALYRAMWKFNLANQVSIDWVFVPTWNDWTEGSQIEPSVEDQGLTLKLTAVAAAQFKALTAEPARTELPAQLFQLRRRSHRLQQIGLTLSQLSADNLNRIGLALAKKDDDVARATMKEVDTEISGLEARVGVAEHLTLVEDGQELVPEQPGSSRQFRRDMPLRLRLADRPTETLQTSFYDAVLEFEFRPTRRGKLEVVTDTSRPPSELGNFGIVADLNLVGPGEWQRARVPLYPSNCVWRHGLPGNNDLEFRGAAEVRNVRLAATCYRVVR